MPDPIVLQQVITVVADQFLVDPAELNADTVADDVDGWDSVSHVMVLLAIEEKLDLALSFEDTIGLQNLGALADYITRRRATAA